MKRLLFFSILFFSFTAQALPDVKAYFVKSEIVSEDQQIKNAIEDADVNAVLRLVKNDVDQDLLTEYVYLASSKLGRVSPAKLHQKVGGALKMAVGMAFLYKTYDYFKLQVSADDKVSWKERYNNMHTVIMDFAGLSGFIFGTDFIGNGLKRMQPRSEFKSKLLIHLYLKSLIK